MAYQLKTSNKLVIIHKLEDNWYYDSLFVSIIFKPYTRVSQSKTLVILEMNLKNYSSIEKIEAKFQANTENITLAWWEAIKCTKN